MSLPNGAVASSSVGYRARVPGSIRVEPQSVHGKRAVVEPACALSMTELIPRVCPYYQCELVEPMAQPDR
jgi:hypothetical protein